jgi:hypothetical protein
MKGRSSKQQQQTVSDILGSLIPPGASARFRNWFPVSKVLESNSGTLSHLAYGILALPVDVFAAYVRPVCSSLLMQLVCMHRGHTIDCILQQQAAEHKNPCG